MNENKDAPNAASPLPQKKRIYKCAECNELCMEMNVVRRGDVFVHSVCLTPLEDVTEKIDKYQGAAIFDCYD